jgi:hypothetical protein
MSWRGGRLVLEFAQVNADAALDYAKQLSSVRSSAECQSHQSIRAHQHNPRECRQFAHSRKSNRRDRTGWLGWEDSNSRIQSLSSMA